MNEETLFVAALEKPAGAERRAFLDAACGADVRLRDRLGRLLAADERTDGVLDGGPGAAAFLPTRADQPDARPDGAVSPPAPPGYELAGVLGEGGMGVVYRATHARLARQVAVKVLHPRFAPDGPTARRFLGEARVTAQLQHPGVPPVHDVGTLPDGRPFLVMKLIQGQTLDALLAGEGADRGRLTAVFEGVCQAVGYAHSRGVIHRDLKPSNIMVGAFAEVQVMDWGLAREMPKAERGVRNDETGLVDGSASPQSTLTPQLTAAGTILGTPAFMSPEQATGAVDRIDPRSDVFALGGLLCVILTGRPPYLAGNAEATRQLAARGHLDDAFARLDGCGADPGLIALCKQCLAVEPADRPADAGEVARAVAGLRAAADDRARKAELDVVRAEGETRVQRNRRRAQLALGVGVGLLLACTTAGVWYADHQAAQRRAETEARHGRNAEAVSALLDQCEAALRADRADQAALALEAAEDRAADGGTDHLAGRLARCRGDVNLLRELDAIDTFGWTASEGQMPENATTAARWRETLTRYGVVVGGGSTASLGDWVNGSPLRERVLAALDRWLAYDPSAEVQAVLRSADPDHFREAIRGALAAKDGVPGDLIMQPQAVAQPARFAVVLSQIGGIPVDRQLAILEGALRSRPGDLSLLMALGNMYQLDRDAAAQRVRWYQAAVAAHPRSGAARNNLALALWDPKNPDAAIDAMRDAVALEPKSASSHFNLGFFLKKINRLDDAIASFQKAISLREDYASAHNNLGNAFVERKQFDRAITHLRRAADLNPSNPLISDNLGAVLVASGDLGGAATAFQKAIDANEDFLPARLRLAKLLATGPVNIRNGAEAVKHAAKACELTDFQNAGCLEHLAAAHAEAGDFKKAVEFQQMALDVGGGSELALRQRLGLYKRGKPYRDPALVPREVPPPPSADR